MNSPSGDTGINPIQLVLEEFIRGAVAERLSWKVIAPDLNLSNLFVGVAVDPFPLGDESADQTIMTLYGSLLTRGIGMGKVDQCFAQVFQFGQHRELGAVVCRNRLEDLIPVFTVL